MSKSRLEKIISKDELLKIWLMEMYKDNSILKQINVDKREIRFTDEIDTEEIPWLIRSIELLHEISPEPILLNVFSNGGNPECALLFADDLKKLKEKDGILVDTQVNGMVASAATIITMSGTGIKYMNKYAHMMFHQVSSWAFGPEKKNDTKSKLGYLDSLTEIIMQFYMENSLVKDKQEWEKITSVDTYMDAKKCKELGIIDVIV